MLPLRLPISQLSPWVPLEALVWRLAGNPPRVKHYHLHSSSIHQYAEHQEELHSREPFPIPRCKPRHKCSCTDPLTRGRGTAAAPRPAGIIHSPGDTKPLPRSISVPSTAPEMKLEISKRFTHTFKRKVQTQHMKRRCSWLQGRNSKPKEYNECLKAPKIYPGERQIQVTSKQVSFTYNTYLGGSFTSSWSHPVINLQYQLNRS